MSEDKCTQEELESFREKLQAAFNHLFPGEYLIKDVKQEPGGKISYNEIWTKNNERVTRR